MNYIDDLFNLNGKVVLVTGACGQLGSAICKSLEQTGAKVVGTDIKLNGKSGDTDLRELDITSRADVENTFEGIHEQYGSIDVLINNAGVSTFEKFEERPEKSFDWVMDVNLKGTFFCIQSYVNLLDQHKQESGAIVNIGSIFGVVSPDFRNYTDLNRKNSEVYGATKAGVIQMTKYFAVHLADRNIRVNAVSPGGIFNPENPQGDDFIKNYSSRTPMNRMANDEDMLGAILYLSGDAAKYTTGQNIVIDGGMSSW
ncbi:MAG TPA: SDR family oxidoreductase [Flavobacteriales bacterium]|nr:SDR family oxidoreductase [Flavobacteriales bacterium]